MTRHLIRLMWNRKRQNVLLMIEIFAAFLVVVAVAVTGLHFGYNAMQSTGFSHEDVWTLEVNRGRGHAQANTAADQLEHDRGLLRQVLGEVAAHPAVERAAGAFTGPYRWYSIGGVLELEGRAAIVPNTNRTDDEFARVLGLELIDGRWFSREDDVAWVGDWEPVVINRRLAVDVFGREDVAGETIVEGPSTAPWDEGRRPRRKRVVGVIDDFRQFGEMSTPTPALFYRRTLDAPADFLELPDILLLKMQPGTTAAVEEGLLRRVRALAPNWSFGIEPVSALREAMLREYYVVPLAITAIVAGAMLLMVALGVTGVVWQNVIQRMREFGLRRAQGATGTGVGRQVITELVVMASFAVAAGCVLLLQIPLLPLPAEIVVVPRTVFVAGVLLAIVAVYSVTILCAWYPSRLATRVPPAEALRYE